MLNWTTESIITLVSGVPLFIGALLLFSKYLKHQNLVLLLLTLSWFLHSLYLTNYGLGYLFLNMRFLKINAVILILNLFLFLCIFDYMTVGRVEPIKFGIAAILSYILVTSAFKLDSVISTTWTNGDPSFALAGDYRTFTAIIGLFMGLLYLYLSLKIILNIPLSMKKWAYLNFTGVFFFTQMVTLSFIFGLTSQIPGIANLISALGGLFSIIAFVRSPQMIYVLPFETFKLMVVDYHGSNVIFIHEWLEDTSAEVSDHLFSSALSALNAFSIEAIKRGNIRELHLDFGIMIIQSYPLNNLQFILLASRTSQILKDNLTTFAHNFSLKYESQFNLTVKSIHEISKIDAIDLVTRSFPYIPMSSMNK